MLHTVQVPDLVLQVCGTFVDSVSICCAEEAPGHAAGLLLPAVHSSLHMALIAAVANNSPGCRNIQVAPQLMPPHAESVPATYQQQVLHCIMRCIWLAQCSNLSSPANPTGRSAGTPICCRLCHCSSSTLTTNTIAWSQSLRSGKSTTIWDEDLEEHVTSCCQQQERRDMNMRTPCQPYMCRSATVLVFTCARRLVDTWYVHALCSLLLS